MQQSEFQWIQSWYQQSDDYILLFSPDGALLWQNRDCPMLRLTTEDTPLFRRTEDGTPQTGIFLNCYHGDLYSVQLERHGTDEVPLYLMRIGQKPFQEAVWNNPAWRHETENQVAAMRQQIFGISNAVTALYHTIEECSDQYSRMLLEEQMQQLNIIKGNCCRLMQPSVLWLEQLKYRQNQEIFGEVLFLDRELSNFIESCQNILGRTIRLHLESESHLRIFANRRRLQSCLLCLLLHIRKQRTEVTQFFWKAKLQQQQIILTCTASSDGTDAHPNRHSSLERLYQTPITTPEESVIRLFCQAYQAVILYTNAEDHMICTMRFPEHDQNKSLSLESPVAALQDDAFSLYQILLSDVSSYRFY